MLQIIFSHAQQQRQDPYIDNDMLKLAYLKVKEKKNDAGN
jgi:hypothetical protein